MLTKEQLGLIYRHAYVPEHLVHYVVAVSGAEPFLHESYLCYVQRGHLIFIGYPLGDDPTETRQAYESACGRFRPSTAAIISARIWLPDNTGNRGHPDAYYRVELPLGPLNPQVAYMCRRAGREVETGQGTFGREHNKLINKFLSGRELGPDERRFFKQVPGYLKRCSTYRLVEARRRGRLVAFNVVDFGSSSYGFHILSFRSQEHYVPGASDLLFRVMADLAEQEGKRALNMGLGINHGIRRFKEKWGGAPFLPYAFVAVRREDDQLQRFLNKL